MTQGISHLGATVTISEVGPRDGLQSIRQVMPTAAKNAWIRKQFEAGTPEIEVGSFVPARLLPQMADTAEVVAHAVALKGLVVAALVPNLHGLRLAVDSGVHKVSIPLSMSESHSLRNVRKSHAEMLEEIRRCVEFLATVPPMKRPIFPLTRWRFIQS